MLDRRGKAVWYVLCHNPWLDETLHFSQEAEDDNDFIH